MPEIKRPVCCGRPMNKAGKAWSGRHKVQQWMCQKCGRRTIKREG